MAARQLLLQKILPSCVEKYCLHFLRHCAHSGQVLWKQCWEQKILSLPDKYLPRIFFRHTEQSNADSIAGITAMSRINIKRTFMFPSFRNFSIRLFIRYTFPFEIQQIFQFCIRLVFPGIRVYSTVHRVLTGRI